MNETCSCGARFEFTRPRGNQWDPDRAKEVHEWMLEWRRNHRHEWAPVEPAPPEQPLIVESGSSHERFGEYMSTESDIPFGFTRNEDR